MTIMVSSLPHLLVFFFAIATVSCSTGPLSILQIIPTSNDSLKISQFITWSSLNSSTSACIARLNWSTVLSMYRIEDEMRYLHTYDNNIYIMNLFTSVHLIEDKMRDLYNINLCTSARLIEDEMRDRVLVYNDTIVHVFIPIKLDLSDFEVPFNLSCKHAGDVWFHVFDYVMKTTLEPDLKTISHLPEDMTVKHILRLKEQRVWMEKLVHGMIEGVKRYLVKNHQIDDTQASTEIMNSVLESENYDELLRLLKRNLDSINITIETCADVVTESYQILPREVVELITKLTLTQLQQQAVQQQIEKVERIQQVIEEEGATILRTKREAEDEKQEEIRLVLMLLVLWFLLCYCSDGTVPWCEDVDLTFGLSLALSEIVLLLGGDIEKNPGPLSSMYNNHAP